MPIVISAIFIFILLCIAAVFAFAAPLATESATCDKKNVEMDSVLLKLVQSSKCVPAIVDEIGDER